MIYLLDVSALLPLLWPVHEHHGLVESWYDPKQEFATCPISELGFIRVSMQVMKSDFGTAVKLLEDFKRRTHHHFWTDDFSPSALKAVQGHKQLTDFYLAELAQHHNGKLATVDRKISHAAVELIR